MGKREGKKPNYKGPAQGKSKLKRWKKGQSSLVNPVTKKHRDAVKSRGFEIKTGPSNLTVEALQKHETNHAEQDEDQAFDALSCGGRTAKTSKTWATNFTNCTNISFNKVLNRYATSKLDAHKQVLAVLAATTEIINSQGGMETDTEYFALLMSSLDSEQLVEDESIAAAAYLLSIVVKKVAVPVLQSRFSVTAKVLLKILSSHANTNVPSLLRSAIVCLAHILRVQDISSWSNEETKHVYYTILTTVVSSKAKVRKAAQLAVRAILNGSTFMTVAGGPASHPAAATTATFCIERIRESGGGNNMTMTLHILELLRGILAVFPKKSMKTACECILQVMTLSNVMLREVALTTLNTMFGSKPSVENLPAEENAKLITAMYDFKPNDSDIRPMELWLSVMTNALCNLSRLDARLCLDHLSRLFKVAMKCLQTVNLSKAAASDINTLITVCIGSSTELAAQLVASSPAGSSPVHKMFRIVENGLSYQYCAVWDLVLNVISSFFDVLGKECHTMMRKCVKALADLRGSHQFPFKELLDKTVGMAVKRMGPEIVLDIIPLLIVGEGIDNFERSWLLPVLRSHVENTELAYFGSYFLPLAISLESKSLYYKERKLMVEYKTYDTLQNQIWSLLPGFCTNPTDLEVFDSTPFPTSVTSKEPTVAKAITEAMQQKPDGPKSITVAQAIAKVIREKPDSRLDMLNALRKLINQNLNNVKERQILTETAPKFLPILFNLYVEQGSDSKDKSFLAVLETIKIFFKIADQKLISKFAKECFLNQSNAESDLNQKYFLTDIMICLVPHMNAHGLSTYLKLSLDQLKSDDKKRQKKAYRLLEEICSCKSEDGRTVVALQLSEIQDHLVENLSTSSPSSKAPRLRCLHHLLQQLDDKDVTIKCIGSILPEVILCTKASGEKARDAAFALLIDMTRFYMQLHPDPAQKGALYEYVVMVMAGLAGSNAHLVSCTELALTKIIFDFKDLFDIKLITALIKSVCTLLQSPSREVVQAALGLVKALLSAFGETIFVQFLHQVVSALVAINAPTRLHFRNKIKDLFSRLSRKFGFEVIFKLVPVSQHKMLNHMRKMQERSARKIKAGKNEEKDDEDDARSKHTDNIDDLLRDTDSEMEDDDATVTSKRGNKKKTKQAQPKHGSAWLKENDDIVDFLDSSAANKVTSTKPDGRSALQAAAAKQMPIKHPFKTAGDGRLVITENDEDEVKLTKNKRKKEEDDLDERFEDIEDAPWAKSRKRKREAYETLEAIDEERNGGKKMKYKAGGVGIHRDMSGKQNSAVQEIGKEYKSKKASGDVKKKDKVDPYAYIPLQFQNLNKRKQAKSLGQFKNLVSGARKGAQKGSKQNKKHGTRK